MCDKTFVRKSALQLHLRLHSGDRPYQCHHCGVKLMYKRNLINHLKNQCDPKQEEVFAFLAKTLIPNKH